MKQSAKTFGYGFSALVLALSGVVISPDVNADTCTIVDGSSAQTATTGGALTLCQNLSSNLTVSKTDDNDTTVDTTMDLAGYSYTGNIVVSAGTLKITDSGVKKGSMKASISVAAGAKVVFDITDKTTVEANDGTIVTYKTNGAAAGDITINGGTFTGDTLIAKSADSTASSNAASVTIAGGDFTGVSTIKNSDLIGVTVSGNSVFATDPSAVATIAGGVFASGSVFVAAPASVITPTAKTTLSVDNELEQAFRVTNSVKGVTNSLDFVVVDNTVGSDTEGEEVDADSIFSIRSVANKGDNKESIADDTVDYHFTAKKVGSYKVTAVAADGKKSAETTFTVGAFDEENAIKDIFVKKGDAITAKSLATQLDKYTDLNIASVSVKDSAGHAPADVNFTVDGKLTVADTAVADTYTVELTFNDASATKKSFKVNVVDPAAITVWAPISQDEDGNFVTIPVVDKLATAWGSPIKTTGSGATVERITENKVETDTLKVTPTSLSAGTTVLTYAADTDAWVYSPANGGTIITDEDAVAEYVDNAANNLKKTVTVHTYKVNGATLYYRAAGTGVTEAKETVNLGDTIDVPSDVKVDLNNPEHYPDTAGNAADIDSASDPKTITSKAVNEHATLDLVLKDAANETKEVKIPVDTYAKDKAIDDEVAYVRIDKTSEVAKATYVSTVNSKLSFNSEDVEVVGGNIVFTPTELGKKTVKVTETLNDKEIATSSIEYNTYGIVDADYYVAPGEALEIAVADPYGTVRVTGANSKDGSVFKNYDEADGKLTLSSDKEDTITIKVSDFLTDSKAIADNGGTSEIKATITVHVAEVYITSEVEATTVEAGEASDAFEIKATEGAIKTEVTSNVTEDAADLAKVSLKSVSKTNNTYQIAVAADAKPGDYEVKVNLTDGANVKATTTIKVRVTKHVAIADGVYTMASKLADNMVLDINGAALNDGANAQLYKSNDTLAQQFLFTADEDGLYTITNLRSGKALDISGGVAANGTNVQQYEKNDTLSQKWEILEDKDGGRMIVSALDSNLVLDVAGGNKKNGANVQVYEMNYTASQAWTIAPVQTSDPIALNAKKSYTIHSALDTNMVLDISGGSTESGANLQLYTANDTDAQSFKFVNEGGLYTITNVNSGKAIDVAGAGRSNGTNVQQYEANGTVAQKWIIEDNGDGTFSFKSAHSDLYLDVAGGHTKDNTNIHVYKGNKTKAQKFRIVEVAE